MDPARSSPSNPITPLISSLYRYYNSQISAVLDGAPMGVTYTASNDPNGGYFLETRNIRIALQTGGARNPSSVFTLGNDLFSYFGQTPPKAFVAVP